MNLVVTILYSLAVLSFLFSIYFFLGYRSQKKEWNQTVKKIFPEEERKSIISRWGERFDERESSQALKNKLHNANLKLLPSEYLGILIVGYMALFVLMFSIFSMPIMVSVLLPLVLITLINYLLFYFRKNSYEHRFNDQLSEVCRILGNAARSGLTINQGIDLVAREVSAPAGDEFKRISNELKMGVTLENALRTVQKRNKSRDFNLFIATLLIQKKTGGNLALTLETMANTFEDRKVLNQIIKTMTSEQKYISLIVPILPIFLLLVMNNVIDGFIDPLWSGVGLVILALFLAAIVLSFILIRKITDIKV
ncbi:type II secretion system F family protein [Alkalibacillus haloalkaliphilus]|uniref:type II secretion system F family protein n=1 Tax=Alkalibacillus haloalkaliphilus TaxID=94136 RepID=UPI0029354936|nr:type II secretion system F family protein [Alkalibacillus haloalkaliphilus]MDV2581459.1 type II secretion system F family protein [Alkalibacillus haloalkaliphilus]